MFPFPLHLDDRIRTFYLLLKDSHSQYSWTHTREPYTLSESLGNVLLQSLPKGFLPSYTISPPHLRSHPSLCPKFWLPHSTRVWVSVVHHSSPSTFGTSYTISQRTFPPPEPLRRWTVLNNYLVSSLSTTLWFESRYSTSILDNHVLFNVYLYRSFVMVLHLQRIIFWH